MFGRFSVFFITQLLLEGDASEMYNRKELAKKYPGFGTDWIPMGHDENGFIIGYFKEPKNQGRFSTFVPEADEAVEFTFFTRYDCDNNGTTFKEFATVNDTFDPDKPTKFIIHGWLAKGLDKQSITIKDGFLDKYDANVFIVDWNQISGNLLYPAAMQATNSVGKYISTFINHLIDLAADPKSIHIVGHSLGAHVAGFTGRNIKQGKIGRITGLDPARPGFDLGIFTGGRLDRSDAEFVDVIHTCAGYLGHPSDIGHADFYPNGGGPPQPQCDSIFELLPLMEACSHGASWNYFAQSLREPKVFKAYKCDSWEEFENNRFCNSEPVPMGDSVPSTTRGKYYLYTSFMTGSTRNG